MIGPEAHRYLEKFYTALFDKLIINFKSLTGNSVLLTILERQATKTLPILTESSLGKHAFPAIIQNELMDDGLIMETDVLGRLAITSKGIWAIELERGQLSTDALLEFIQKKYFQNMTKSAKPLTEKEKVVIMTLLAGRAFSAEWPMDLLPSEARDAWLRILKESCSFLRSLGLIQEITPDDFAPKKSLEDPVFETLTHMNLGVKTKRIFHMSGDRKYLLNIGNNVVDVEKLKFLFQLIIGSHKLSSADIDRILTFLETTFTRENIFLFDKPESSPFFGHAIRTQIRNALMMYETA